MFKVIIKNILLVILISITNKQAIAISGEEISAKVSQWLIKEGIKATPVFPKNTFYKLIHKIGTYILLHFVGLITLNLKEYRFLYKSLDFYPQPEVHLTKNNYTNLVIERVGIFDFVYLGVFTK